MFGCDCKYDGKTLEVVPVSSPTLWIVKKALLFCLYKMSCYTQMLMLRMPELVGNHSE